MKTLLLKAQKESFTSHLFSFFLTISLGVISKLYTLVVFLLSIRVISMLFQSSDGLESGQSIYKLLPSIQYLHIWLALTVIFAFGMVGVLDYWFLKARSRLAVYSLTSFEKIVVASANVTSPANVTRASNSYRMVFESFVGYLVFGLVCVAAISCLFMVNIYFGILLSFSLVLLVVVGRLLPKSLLRKFLNRVPDFYHSKIFSGLDENYSGAANVVTEKYRGLFLQQGAFFLAHLLVGVTMGLLVLTNATGYLDGIDIFDVVVFIYSVRFIANNGRNALLSYIKYKSNISVTVGYLEAK